MLLELEALVPLRCHRHLASPPPAGTQPPCSASLLLIAPPPPSSSPDATFPQWSTTARIGGVAQDGREGAMADHCGESEAGQQGRWRHGSASSSLLLDSLCSHLRCLKPRPAMSRLPLTSPVPRGHRHGRPSRRGPLHLDEACVHRDVLSLQSYAH